MQEIDLLRFCAAMVVLFYHFAFRGYAADGFSIMPTPALSETAKYGYLGVELFFAISGYVIVMSASRETIPQFLASRVARLFPAYWIACTITFIVCKYSGARAPAMGHVQYLQNMTMLNGFFDVPFIDGAYWSLFVEMKFYFVISLMLVLRRFMSFENILYFWFFACVALRHLSYVAHDDLDLSKYAPFFTIGIVSYFVRSERLTYVRSLMFIAAWAAGLWQSVDDVASLQVHYRHEFSEVTIAVITTAICVVFALIAFRKLKVLGAISWKRAGALTYPLYLVHQYIGYVVINTLFPALDYRVTLLITLAVCLALAYVINRFVERRYSGRLRALVFRQLSGVRTSLT